MKVIDLRAPALPSIDEPEPGSSCPACGELLRIVGFCGPCHERAIEAVLLGPTDQADSFAAPTASR